MQRIPVAGPSITTREVEYVAEAVRTAWYANARVYNEQFERAFADYVGRRYAIALPSCTSALHLALLSLGLGVGDEVVVPDVTWIATSAPISYIGGRPVFADIEPDSWCLSCESLRQRITPRTKAVIVVDLYGSMPDMDAILDLARHHDIAVIEDAAEAIGSEYRGRKAGSFGEVSTFSFHGSKTLTTGEGGMLVTDSEAIYNKCLVLRDHGRAPGPKMFWNNEVAYKYTMSSLQAALGLAQLERIDELLHRKRQIFQWYQRALGGLEGVALNDEKPWIRNSYWMSTIVWDGRFGISKEEAQAFLKERNIDTRPFFYPLTSMPAYQGQADCVPNETSARISAYAINLPSALNLTEAQVDYVSSTVAEMLRSARTR